MKTMEITVTVLVSANWSNEAAWIGHGNLAGWMQAIMTGGSWWISNTPECAINNRFQLRVIDSKRELWEI